MKELSERSKIVLNKLFAKIEQDTDDNLHTEARFKIANSFYFIDRESRIFLVLRDMYGIMLREEEQQGCISKELYNLRHSLDEQLFSNIKDIYGEDMLVKVKKCL